MTDRSNENVPRGDHVPGGQSEDTESRGNLHAEPGTDSAGMRGHGAHGKRGAPEEHADPATPTPDFTKGTDRGGSAAWGSERSGGSIIDKRGPEQD